MVSAVLGMRFVSVFSATDVFLPRPSTPGDPGSSKRNLGKSSYGSSVQYDRNGRRIDQSSTYASPYRNGEGQSSKASSKYSKRRGY